MAVVPRTRSNSVILRLAERYQVEPADFLRMVKATIMPGSKVSDEHLMAFLLVADQYGLNPLTKQVYAFPGKDGGVVPIVSIDGWLSIANAHPQFDGLAHEDILHDGELVAIRCQVWRKDRGHPVEATEYLSECRRNTEPWKQWPARMLRHKATIQALRMAFGLSGIYDPDEGERIIEASAVTREAPRGSTARLEAALAVPQPEPDPPAPEPEPEPDAPSEDRA